MKNLIYYNKNKCDVYFKKITNKYVKANNSQIYIEDINKFNIKNCVVTFEVKNFLIKSLSMPLDNYINDRILNSLKFYFNNFDDDILYDYFLLDSELNSGQVKILLYALKIQKDVQDILKYIDKSYLVVRPLQFIMLEYLSYKYQIPSGIFLDNINHEQYNVVVFNNSLILVNDYINKNGELSRYLNEKVNYVKDEFNVDLNREVYFLNDSKNIGIYDFKFDFIDYTMEEILTQHDYFRSKFSKFWKKNENFKKNA